MQATLTQSTQPVPTASNVRHWVGWTATALAALFLVFDGVTKLAGVQPVVEAMQRLGYPQATASPIGLILLACVGLYLLPRTALLGAVLLTGFLGGAISAHVRIEDPLFSHTLFPVYVAALVWGGLYLRDARVRAMLRSGT
jgi:hypothetical protein